MARVSKSFFARLPQFVQKIASKTTEVKNLDNQIQALNAQKAQLESNNQSTSQVQAQLTQKQNTLAKKVIKVETKVNSIVKTTIQTKISQTLGSIGSNESGYDVTSWTTFFSKDVSFNGSPYYNLYGRNTYSDGLHLIFGIGVSNSYFSSRFVMFKGQESIDWLNNYAAFEANDSRGYYGNVISINGNFQNIGNRFRTNWKKYKRNDIWCLYDALNDIMYYCNYTGIFVPTKKWYRSDILYKTEIELKTRNTTSSGSSSGSGGSADGTGNSIGTDLVDQFLGGSGSDGSSGGNSIGTDLVDQFLGGSGSDGSSGGQSIGTSLIDQFLLGPLFGPTSVNYLDLIGTVNSLYQNGGCDSCQMVNIDTANNLFVYRDQLFTAATYSKPIDFTSNKLPLSGYVDMNNSNNIISLTPSDSNEDNWIVILGTANGFYNNAYWINNVKTTLNQNGKGNWGGNYYINATITTLDENGNGIWNGINYINGTPDFPIDGLLAFWDLNETSSNRENYIPSSATNLLTFGEVSFASGKVGNCASFNGVNGGGSVNGRLGSTDFSVNVNSNFSFSVWMKPRSFNGDQHIIGAPFQNGFYIGANGQNLTFNLFNGSVWGISAPTTDLDTWHHYVFIRDGNTLKLYADNVYIGSTSVFGQNFPNASKFSVGGGEYNEYYFNGDIDAMGAWSRVITEEEIAKLYNNGNGIEL